MKDSYYFQHDSNARNDPKLKALMNTYGLEGYGRFWIIIEMMRESSCYKLEDQAYVWESLAEYCKAELQEVQKFVDDCVNSGQAKARAFSHFLCGEKRVKNPIEYGRRDPDTGILH